MSDSSKTAVEAGVATAAFAKLLGPPPALPSELRFDMSGMYQGPDTIGIFRIWLPMSDAMFKSVNDRAGEMVIRLCNCRDPMYPILKETLTKFVMELAHANMIARSDVGQDAADALARLDQFDELYMCLCDMHTGKHVEKKLMLFQHEFALPTVFLCALIHTFIKSTSMGRCEDFHLEKRKERAPSILN